MSTFLEKIAANRLGKEVLKKWLSQSKTPAAQSFQNKVVNSLMGAKVHPKASGADRVKFLARGGDETTKKVAMPTQAKKKTLVPKKLPKPSPEFKQEKRILDTKNPAKAKVFSTKKPAANDNKYMKRIAVGATAAAGVGAAGYGIHRISREK